MITRTKNGCDLLHILVPRQVVGRILKTVKDLFIFLVPKKRRRGRASYSQATQGEEINVAIAQIGLPLYQGHSIPKNRTKNPHLIARLKVRFFGIPFT